MSDRMAQVERLESLRPAVEAALRRAVRRAVWEHKQLGYPVCTWRDGRVVWIAPEDIAVERPDDDAPPAAGPPGTAGL